MNTNSYVHLPLVLLLLCVSPPALIKAKLQPGWRVVQESRWKNTGDMDDQNIVVGHGDDAVNDDDSIQLDDLDGGVHLDDLDDGVHLDHLDDDVHTDVKMRKTTICVIGLQPLASARAGLSTITITITIAITINYHYSYFFWEGRSVNFYYFDQWR